MEYIVLLDLLATFKTPKLTKYKNTNNILSYPVILHYSTSHNPNGQDAGQLHVIVTCI